MDDTLLAISPLMLEVQHITTVEGVVNLCPTSYNGVDETSQWFLHFSTVRYPIPAKSYMTMDFC